MFIGFFVLSPELTRSLTTRLCLCCRCWLTAPSQWSRTKSTCAAATSTPRFCLSSPSRTSSRLPMTCFGTGGSLPPLVPRRQNTSTSENTSTAATPSKRSPWRGSSTLEHGTAYWLTTNTGTCWPAANNSLLTPFYLERKFATSWRSRLTPSHTRRIIWRSARTATWAPCTCVPSASSSPRAHRTRWHSRTHPTGGLRSFLQPARWTSHVGP